MSDETRPTTLYRYFDEQGHLLYVGITSSGGGRMHQHAQTSVWWPRVSSTSYQHFGSREAALAAERAAIKQERPLYNGTHNPRRRSAKERAAIELRWNHRRRTRQERTQRRAPAELDTCRGCGKRLDWRHRDSGCTTIPRLDDFSPPFRAVLVALLHAKESAEERAS